MAQVPYDPVPTGAPGPLPTEGPRVDTPGAAFGTNIGEAIQRGGAQVGQAGNELFQTALQIQKTILETQTRDRLSALNQELAPMQADFDSTKGPAARAGLQAHLAAVNQLRLKYRQGLPPIGQVMFDSEAGNLQNWTVRVSTAHAVQEHKDWVTSGIRAQQELISQQGEDDPNTDINTRRDKMGNLAVDWAMAKHGVGPNDPIAKTAKFEAESAFDRRRLEGLSKTGQSEEAMKQLPDAKLTEDDRIRATSIIEAKAASAAAFNIADTITAKYSNGDGTYNRTTRQMQDEAREMARTQFAGNKDMTTQVSANAVAHLDRLTSNNRYATRVDDLDTRNQIAQIVAETGARSAAEFSVDPKGAVIWNKMTPVQRRGLDNTIIGLNNQALTKTDETLKHTITGKRNSDLEDYLNQNPYDPKWHLSLNDADKIAKDQAGIIRKPTDNPAVTRSMKYLQEAYGPAMEEAGLMLRDKKNPDDYDHFMGALQAFIDVHRDETGKPVTHDDLDKEWPALIRKQMVKGFFARAFGGEGSPDYVFKQWQRPTIEQVPEEYRQLAIGEAVKAGGAIPSDTQIYHRFIADTFNKLFQQEQKTAQEPAGGGPPKSR